MKVKIDVDIDILYRYYCEYTLEYTDFIVFDREEFVNEILNDKLCFYAYEDDLLVGFISMSLVEKTCFVSLLYGSDQTKIGLLKHAEEELRKNDIKELWFHFFNPVKIAWVLEPGITHPGIQGVELDSPTHKMLLEYGFVENSVQETYYLNLKVFDDSLTKQLANASAIDFYNPLMHKGFTEFINELESDSWAKELSQNQSLKTPLRLLVALEEGVVKGFAGPIKLGKNNRGYFAGIMISKDMRGKKLGTALFFRLCSELKHLGAEYMTFFTGSNNPARFIYLKARCRVVKRFVTLKKNV
jgi:hypothetical protein